MRDLKDLHDEWRKHEGDASDLYPPLTKAVVEGDFFRLAQLLKGKPDLEYEAITKGNFAFRPIHFAADCGNDAVSAALLTMLLQAGADPNAIARDVQNWKYPRSPTTPLLLACSMRHHAAAIVLLIHGADANGLSSGYTPLYCAAELDDALMVRVLVAHRANISGEPTDQNAVTPMHWAAAYGSAEACKALWYEGADLDARDKTGKTPVGWAIKKGHKEMVKLLQSFGSSDEAQVLDDVTLPGTPMADDDPRGTRVL